MNPDESRDAWARHYDGLLWTVTGILLAMDGALLVRCSDFKSYDLMLALGGLGLTVATVHFGASFRELRQRVIASEGKTQHWQEGRRLFQWEWFVGIFAFVEVCWGRLILEHWRWAIGWFWAIAILTVVATAWPAWHVRRKHGSAKPR